MIKSEKYQQDKVMITQLLAYWILIILNKKKQKTSRLIAVDLSKQKALDTNLRAIQQITFTGKIKATEDNRRVIIITFLNNQKKQC